MKKNKILLINQFNSDNLGDKLLNVSLCNKLKENGFLVRNLGFAQTTNQEISFENEKLSNIKTFLVNLFPEHLKFSVKYKKRLEKLTKNINSKDFSAVVIGGGQLIKHNSVFLDCLNYWVNWTKKNNLPMCLYGVGVDDNISKIEIEQYKSLLRKFDYINCRDNETLSFFKNVLGIESVMYSPDIAFTLRKTEDIIKDNSVVIMPYSYNKAVDAFSLKKSRNEYYDDIMQSIDFDYSEQHIILSATTSIDARECLLFQNYLKKRKIFAEIVPVNNSRDLINLISKAKCVVTGRMHAMIICSVVNTRILPIIISGKIHQYMVEYVESGVDISTTINKSEEGVEKLVKFIKENSK